jgi:hypothetical protein
MAQKHLLLPLLLAAAAPAQQLWWEAESPTASNFPRDAWPSARHLGESRQHLSGGEWLCASGKRGPDPLQATYTIEAPANGDYALWVRKFYTHGPFAWRFDREPEQHCLADCALADSVPLIPNVCANWVELGGVRLTKGEHRFTITLHGKAGEATTAAFDCFLLTVLPFVPDGRRKPDEADDRKDPGKFAWTPPPDPFDPAALLDLRFLNEKVAGERGPVRADGGRLRRGDGEELRCFGVNAGPGVWLQSHQTHDYLARKLAKLGVNLVRLHGPLVGKDPRQLDPRRVDALCHLIAACKQQGIYTTVSSFFPLWFRIDGSWGIADYDDRQQKHPFAAIYFDERLQAIQRGWLRQLLGTENPYTGVTLGREPALAAVELVNEDSLFFWTFTQDHVPPKLWQRLGEQFGETLLPAWNLTRDGMAKSPPAVRERAVREVRFLAGLQREYYGSTTKFVRDELGYRGLVVASNWHVSDPAQLDAVERWTYEPADWIDAHGYFAAPHKGPRAAHAVDVGDTFADRGFVDAPEQLPLQIVQTEGKPQLVSEIGWPAPNRRRCDGMLVASAYAAGNGIDGLCWFAVDSPWLRDSGAEKFGIGTPDQLWTAPVAALIYRRGDVTEAPPVLRTAWTEASLFALGGSTAGAPQLDPLRAVDGPGGKGLDVRVFLRGPVVRSFAGGEAVVAPEVAPHESDGITRHANGQLALDEKRRLFTVDAPRCQAVTGELAKAGKVALGDCVIHCNNTFGSLAVVSLDDRPIASSRKLLVQASTPSVPFGFRETDGRIVTLGGAPAQVERIDASVELPTGGPIRRVRALDQNGMARPESIPVAGYRITLPADTSWVLVER